METVLFLDVETGRVVRIPAAELRPGTIQVRVQGMDELVWVLPEQLQAGPVRHPPFSEEVRAYLHEIQETFAEYRPLSVEEWEDGFRRDVHPEQEIALWLHAAQVFGDFLAREPLDEAARRDGYRVIVACLTAPRESIWRVLELSVLSREDAEWIIDRFYPPREGEG